MYHTTRVTCMTVSYDFDKMRSHSQATTFNIFILNQSWSDEILSGVSSRCRIEKKDEKEREHKPEGTRGCTRLEVFEKDAMKKDDHNHPNSLQQGNYEIENWKISENMTKHDTSPSAKRCHCASSNATVLGRKTKVWFVRTRLLRSKLTTFMGKEPWHTIQESLLKIMRKLLCAVRASNQIAAPVARSNTEAAPHTIESVDFNIFLSGSSEIYPSRWKTSKP